MKNINSPPVKKSKTNMGITGLTNIGNTCFMNSALQCLFNLPEFNDYFLQDKYVKDLRSNNKEIAKQYAKLLKNIRGSGSSNSYYSRGENTQDLKRAIEKVAPIFSGYGQQDSQEFLRCLIDGLHEDLNRIVRKPPYRELQADLSKHDIKHISHDWFNYYKSIDDSVIQDFFRGQLSNKVTCNKCGYESLAFDNFLDISLSFSGRATLLHNVSLEQLIQVFLNKEDQIEEYYCSKYDNSFDDAIYDLVGIVNHSGSLSGGHYTSECMNPYDHRWYRFNDSHVSEVNMDQTQYDTSGSPSPYILFYVKRNLHKN
ncbi:hypothetical protein PPERSA_11288 [Pseudocohnilembus persalinus]|uniref:USP domain-containing protein n=1 Tax=Pseudocohnilembus persalinus TaxID=266149 RepID=A0A0V0QPR2_PSEPJ|nr:hypothetical protein PPERSA_11288 [Pseudocohnilembus persalinus]|eukprot:KRX04164.1 hypothetical protein PPERSA_11288 [Pseudocohnilembus persalinus]